MASKLFQKNENHPMELNAKYETGEEANINKIELGKLFHLIKYLVREPSSLNKPSSQGLQLQNILEHIIKKIGSKQKLGLDKFIAFFSITVYVHISVQTKEQTLIYGNNFYHNVCYYISKIIDNWNAGPAIAQIDRISKSNMSILLCSLASVVQQQKNRSINLETKKIFTSPIIKLLFSLRLPNEQKMMRHYKSLILYFDEQAVRGASKKLLIQSLKHHFVNCDSMKGAQIACVYMLNRMVNWDSAEDNACSKWLNSEKNQILMACLKLMPFCSNSSQVKIVMKLFKNVVVTMDKIQDQYINGQLVLLIFQMISNRPKPTDRMSPSFKSTVPKMNPISRQLLFQRLITENELSILALEIIQLCLLQMSIDFLILVIESGYFQKLLHFYGEIDQTSYKKYTLFKSISNIIKNSQCSAELSNTLKKVWQYNERGNEKYALIFEQNM